MGFTPGGGQKPLLVSKFVWRQLAARCHRVEPSGYKKEAVIKHVFKGNVASNLRGRFAAQAQVKGARADGVDQSPGFHFVNLIAHSRPAGDFLRDDMGEQTTAQGGRTADPNLASRCVCEGIDFGDSQSHLVEYAQ
jgi:hypothetical protein